LPDIPREQQVAETMAITGMLYDQGYRKVAVHLTGKSIRIEAEAGDGAKVSGVVPLSRRQR
jgi:hypothetical protein